MMMSVVGLGKLGLPLLASIASKGYPVWGFDINSLLISDLKTGIVKLNETGLKGLVLDYKDNIHPTSKLEEAVLNSEVTFIIIPTPSQKNGYFSLKYINEVIKNIGKVLKKKKEYHLVVIVSTVMPGSTDKIKNLLEKYSGKICGKDFGLCYNPEFIALGSVIFNLLNPDFILIGESDKKSGDILEKFYLTYCDNKPRIARMNFINAELAKISVNTFITTKISYANMLSEICEKLPGGDVDVVTQTIGLDSRIGGKYFKGGAAFGGPCFPRDNIAFISLAKRLKSTSSIPQATHSTNLRQLSRLTEKVLQYWRPNKTVAIIGVSYKPFTDVIDESTGLLLAQALKEKNVRLNLHDPLALKNAEKVLGLSGVEYIKNLKDCVLSSDILVITTNWPEFENITESWFNGKEKVIIDPWRMINATKFAKNITYLPLGINVLE